MISLKERPGILNRLCKSCDRIRSLPKSMIIPFESIQANFTNPVAHGGFGDVYQGEHKGCPAAVKLMRLYVSSDRDKFLSVRF